MCPSNRIEVLLVHVGRKEGLKKPLSLPALGILALADYLEQQGVRTRVLNIPLMQIEDPQFDLFQFIDRQHIPLVGISLHWYLQLYEGLALARKIKSRCPQTRVLLGGFTASFFWRELMDGYDSVDYIVRGDAEVPLVKLARSLRQGKEDLSRVPNLIWRRKRTVVRNRQGYAATAGILNRMSFFNTANLINDSGLSLRNPQIYSPGRGKILYYNIGRGCPVNCSFCGGGACAQVLLNRRNVVVKSTPAVLKDLRDAQRLGVECLATSFDPYPDSRLYINLFRRMREGGLAFDLFFVAWGLPTERLLGSMAQTFGKTEIVLSPVSGSEKIRRRNRGFFYTNQELLRCMEQGRHDRIRFQVHFSVGIPFETQRDTLETMALIKRLKQYPNVTILVEPLLLDPVSPMFLKPEKYQVTLHRKTLQDFLKASLDPDFDYSPGYSTPHFSEREIVAYNERISRMASENQKEE